MRHNRQVTMLKEVLTNKKTLSREDIIFLLNLSEKGDLETLYEAAYAIKTRYVGKRSISGALLNLAMSAGRTAIIAASERTIKI
jgi:biotin synthase-like enzyme